MSTVAIPYNDGPAYDRMMAPWTQSAGEIFLAWLAAPRGGRWLDVGCGTGAFTERLISCLAPDEIRGVDPSQGQLAYARTRGLSRVIFDQGDAVALPYADGSFDGAIHLAAEAPGIPIDDLGLRHRQNHAHEGRSDMRADPIRAMRSRCRTPTVRLMERPWP